MNPSPTQSCLLRLLSLSVLVTLPSVFIGLGSASATTAKAPVRATSTIGTTAPSGWFLQLSTVGPNYPISAVTRWLGTACKLPVSSRPSLVLQDIVDSDGQLATADLDAIAPYLPGGGLHCVSALYVGTTQPAPTDLGSPYTNGVESPAYRADYVATSRSLAAQFVGRYPSLKFNWYLSYEANLNDQYYPDVESAYSSLLTQAETALSQVRATGFLWSPAFWYPWSSYEQNAAGMAGLTQGLGALFSALRQTGRRLVIDLQDYVAGSACQPSWNRMTPSDAVGWVRYLASVPAAPAVELNIEQYQTDCTTGGMTSADPAELAARTATYVDAQIPLGPAFELRYAPSS
jgi:hypothetical protein